VSNRIPLIFTSAARKTPVAMNKSVIHVKDEMKPMGINKNDFIDLSGFAD